LFDKDTFFLNYSIIIPKYFPHTYPSFPTDLAVTTERDKGRHGLQC